MRKIALVVSVFALLLASCGSNTKKYITDESISQLSLASVSAFTQAQQQLEIIGSDFKIGDLPEGDVQVCNKPVPRALVDVLGKDMATDLKLAVCLSEGRNLKPVLDKDDAFLADLESLVLSYDIESFMYDVACLESLKLDEKNWRDQLPFRKGVPTVPIRKDDVDKAKEKLAKIKTDFGENIKRIVGNLKQSGGDMEMVFWLEDSGKEIKTYFESYCQQVDGPAMPYADSDTIIMDRMAKPYAELFGQELKLTDQ